jgi:hypothetical protein
MIDRNHDLPLVRQAELPRLSSLSFAAVVGASLRPGYAPSLCDAPTTAYYTINRLRLHLSRAKHCLDEASHLFAP